MSAQDGDTVMQEDALDQEEELALGEEKLKVVGLFTASTHLCCVPLASSLSCCILVATEVSKGLCANVTIVTGCHGNSCFIPDREGGPYLGQRATIFH
jgi:hypothetical protein